MPRASRHPMSSGGGGHDFVAEAGRQSRLIAERAIDQGSDEAAAVMRWIEDVSDPDGWTA